jgi:hypothetical protein
MLLWHPLGSSEFLGLTFAKPGGRRLVPTSSPMPSYGCDEQNCGQHYENSCRHDAMPPKHQCARVLSSALWANRRQVENLR